MKRIIQWIESRFSRSVVPTEVDPPGNVVAQRQMVSQGTNVVMPDINSEAKHSPPNITIVPEGHAATVPNFKILEQPSPDVGESAGFNPYDTAVLQKKPDSKPRSN